MLKITVASVVSLNAKAIMQAMINMITIRSRNSFRNSMNHSGRVLVLIVFGPIFARIF